MMFDRSISRQASSVCAFCRRRDLQPILRNNICQCHARNRRSSMRYQAPTADSPVIVDGKSFVDQDSLGLYLVKAYKLRSERDITSCNTCHR